ncbi:MAG TPA: FHA domain-containing protein [Ktedonobacterales bacterium]|nr:FHA domain-containing protein [Ktedonobacterales bacterium]HEX5571545.1 FHA domain-containing protein [Ktedonobacterales bacterium]
MAVCPHCGQETDGTLPFCQFCGQRLAVESGSASGLPSWLTRSSSSATATAEAAPPAALVTAQMVVRMVAITPTVAGQTVGREFALAGHEMRIGRAPSCEINLDGDPLVSRFHAVLRPHDGGYAITDLGSSNGTLVNNAEIHAETPLREGDEITIGECRMSVTSSFYEIDTAQAPQSQPLVAPASPFGMEAPAMVDDPFAISSAPTGAVEVFPAAPALPEEPAAPPPPKEPEPEELRDQIGAISAHLAQQARDAIVVAEHYRNALEDARQRVTGALSLQPTADSVTYKGDLNSLSDLVRQVVENPQHLELVTRLASRATELNAALDTLNATAPYANLLGALTDLRQKVEEALKR